MANCGPTLGERRPGLKLKVSLDTKYFDVIKDSLRRCGQPSITVHPEDIIRLSAGQNRQRRLHSQYEDERLTPRVSRPLSLLEPLYPTRR